MEVLILSFDWRVDGLFLVGKLRVFVHRAKLLTIFDSFQFSQFKSKNTKHSRKLAISTPTGTTGGRGQHDYAHALWRIRLRVITNTDRAGGRKNGRQQLFGLKVSRARTQTRAYRRSQLAGLLSSFDVSLSSSNRLTDATRVGCDCETATAPSTAAGSLPLFYSPFFLILTYPHHPPVIASASLCASFLSVNLSEHV